MINILKLYQDKYINFGAPICVFFDITNNCNLNCFYCFSNDNNLRKATDKGLSTDEIKKILQDLNNAGTKVVEFSGGEPLLHKDFFDILHFSYKLGFIISFVSNGTLFNDEVCSKLVPLVSHINITLRGCDEDSHDKVTGIAGSYARTISSIKLLNKYGINVGILLDPTYLNYERIYDYISQLVEKEGVILNSIFLNRINIRNMDNQGVEKQQYCLRSIDEYETVFEQLHKIHLKYNIFTEVEAFPMCKVNVKYHQYLTRCNYGISSASIDYQGNLKMCPVSSKVLGNLKHNSIKELWNESPTINEFRSLKWINTKCRTCADFENCGGGCYTSRPETMTYQDDYYHEEIVYSNDSIPYINSNVIIKNMNGKAIVLFKRIVPRLLPIKKYNNESDILEITGIEYKLLQSIDSQTCIEKLKDKFVELNDTQFDNMLISLVSRGIISVNERNE